MKILLVGCGRMGGAMAHAWSADHDVSAFDPGATLPPAVRRVPYLGDIAETAYDVVVLAVKPQAFPDVAASLLHVVADAGCLLSIMAGVTIASIQNHLGGPLPTVRAMPNMPATIGQGITAAVASAALPSTERQMIETLLQRLGDFVWLDAEQQIDLVTAISGSGPAYLFRVAESLALAARSIGLPDALSDRLARATFTGAGALAAHDAAPLQDLRAQVTSKGGTTEAGLEALNAADALDTLVERAVSAAVARAHELARQ